MEYRQFLAEMREEVTNGDGPHYQMLITGVCLAVDKIRENAAKDGRILTAEEIASLSTEDSVLEEAFEFVYNVSEAIRNMSKY